MIDSMTSAARADRQARRRDRGGAQRARAAADVRQRHGDLTGTGTEPDEQAAIHIGNCWRTSRDPALPARHGAAAVAAGGAARRARGGAAPACVAQRRCWSAREVVRCGIVLPVASCSRSRRRAAAGRATRCRPGCWRSRSVLAASSSALIGPRRGAVVRPLTAAFWAIGRVVRARGDGGGAAARTAELREARDERARLEVATDRARLSRELDELLQRRLGRARRGWPTRARARAIADARRRAGARSSTRAGARSRRCARRSGCCATTAARPDGAPQPDAHAARGAARARKGARRPAHGRGQPARAAAGRRAVRVPGRGAPARRARGRPDVDVACASRDDGAGARRSPGRPSGARGRRSSAHASAPGCSRGTLEATVRGGRAEAVVSLPVVAVVWA